MKIIKKIISKGSGQCLKVKRDSYKRPKMYANKVILAAG